MNAMIKVARYHLLTPVMLLGLPWAALAFVFAVNLARGGDAYRSGIVAFFLLFFVAGVQRAGRWLPFALALGVTRRCFYAGTALLGASVSLASGLLLAGLQAIERATGGWGLSVTFFRVPGILNGPWYATWLTSFVGLSALFTYGMWYGTVNRRWGMLGLIAFIVAQVLAGLIVMLAYSWSGAGGSIPGRLDSLSALGQAGVAAALAVVFVAGGQATIRRVTV